MLRLLGLLLAGVVTLIQGHGRLLVPPARTSMWREDFKTVKDYNDNQLNCGGFANQWYTHKGKCGVCGDPWQGPRDSEAGGKYAAGIITRNYQQGQVIDVKIEITANHKGSQSFYLCPHNNPTTQVTEDCFKKYILANQTGQTKFPIPSDAGIINLKLCLPKDVTCTQCVLKWKYVCGNNWGCDAKRCCVGCGEKQEHFYGCSDIAIVTANHSKRVVPSKTGPPTMTSTSMKTVSPTRVTPLMTRTPRTGNMAWLRCPKSFKCTPVATYSGIRCTLYCESEYCPIVPCRCTCPVQVQRPRSPSF